MKINRHIENAYKVLEGVALSEEEALIECGEAKLRISRGAIGGVIDPKAAAAEEKK